MKTLGKILLVIVGIFYIFMGITSLFNPGATLVSLSIAWSIMTLSGGIATIVAFFFLKGVPGRVFILIMGILETISGFILVSSGALFSTIIALNVLQAWTILSGITFIVDSFEEKKAGFKYWWLSLILGILCLIIGLSSFSSAVFNTILCAQFVGVGLMSAGAAIIYSAFAKTKAKTARSAKAGEKTAEEAKPEEAAAEPAKAEEASEQSAEPAQLEEKAAEPEKAEETTGEPAKPEEAAAEPVKAEEAVEQPAEPEVAANEEAKPEA